jgi:transaldolase
MKPTNLKTKIFLDTSDPNETKEAIKLLGFLDGQTTNPTSFVSIPNLSEKLKRNEKFTNQEILSAYKDVVKEISSLLPHASVSIEVYADHATSAEDMIKQGKEMYSWIPNAQIKLPINKSGLQAAEYLSKEGFRLNMTLCFTQEQAAAVYSATKDAKESVFVSPFIGRLFDRGENGMDLIANIIKMYKNGDGHVEVLSASVKRSFEHFLYSLRLGADIVTAPLSTFREWARLGMTIPGEDYKYESKNVSAIEYKDISLDKNWHEYNIKHELTNKGIDKFAQDWNSLIK